MALLGHPAKSSPAIQIEVSLRTTRRLDRMIYGYRSHFYLAAENEIGRGGNLGTRILARPRSGDFQPEIR